MVIYFSYSFKFIHLKTHNIVFFRLLFHIQQSMTRNFYMIIISTNQSFISQIWRIVGPLGEKLDFLSPLGFEIQRSFDNKT